MHIFSILAIYGGFPLLSRTEVFFPVVAKKTNISMGCINLINYPEKQNPQNSGFSHFSAFSTFKLLGTL